MWHQFLHQIVKLTAVVHIQAFEHAKFHTLVFHRPVPIVPSDIGLDQGSYRVWSVLSVVISPLDKCVECAACISRCHGLFFIDTPNAAGEHHVLEILTVATPVRLGGVHTLFSVGTAHWQQQQSNEHSEQKWTKNQDKLQKLARTDRTPLPKLKRVMIRKPVRTDYRNWLKVE